jgi:hypothetical protein
MDFPKSVQVAFNKYKTLTPEVPYTDPNARWCDSESWRQPTYVDFWRRLISVAIKLLCASQSIEVILLNDALSAG